MDSFPFRSIRVLVGALVVATAWTALPSRALGQTSQFPWQLIIVADYPSEWTCPGCKTPMILSNCTLQYETAGSYTWYRVYECPHCGSDVYVPKDMPSATGPSSRVIPSRGLSSTQGCCLGVAVVGALLLLILPHG